MRVDVERRAVRGPARVRNAAVDVVRQLSVEVLRCLDRSGQIVHLAGLAEDAHLRVGMSAVVAALDGDA